VSENAGKKIEGFRNTGIEELEFGTLIFINS
jgi:hypothetical protein